jgi:hypothetical protein
MKTSSEHVFLVFKKLFGTNPESKALFIELLSYDGNEPERVRMAILKLSDGDPDRLLHNIQVARSDYRDVLAWAEYPEQMDTGASHFNSEPDQINAIMQRDREQYDQWLKELEDD